MSSVRRRHETARRERTLETSWSSAHTNFLLLELLKVRHPCTVARHPCNGRGLRVRARPFSQKRGNCVNRTRDPTHILSCVKRGNFPKGGSYHYSEDCSIQTKLPDFCVKVTLRAERGARYLSLFANRANTLDLYRGTGVASTTGDDDLLGEVSRTGPNWPKLAYPGSNPKF